VFVSRSLSSMGALHHGDVLPDGVTLGADVSIRGGGESVAPRAEGIADRAEWPKEAWRVLG